MVPIEDIAQFKIDSVINNSGDNRTKARDLYDANFILKNYPNAVNDTQVQQLSEFDLSTIELRYHSAFVVDNLLKRTGNGVEEIVLELGISVEKEMRERGLSIEKINLNELKIDTSNGREVGKTLYQIDNSLIEKGLPLSSRLKEIQKIADKNTLQLSDSELKKALSLTGEKKFTAFTKLVKSEIKQSKIIQNSRINR